MPRVQIRRKGQYASKTFSRKADAVSLKRATILEYGQKRAKEGAGPATLAADISYIHTIIIHAAAVHGAEITTQEVDLARVALRRLGLIGRSNERDRRPTQNELDRLISYFENFSTTNIPIARIIKFAIANARTRCIIVRDRKDPRNKYGNHQRVPLLDLTGYDAWALLEEQKYISI